jgi:hypothetical protein
MVTAQDVYNRFMDNPKVANYTKSMVAGHAPHYLQDYDVWVFDAFITYTFCDGDGNKVVMPGDAVIDAAVLVDEQGLLNIEMDYTGEE